VWRFLLNLFRGDPARTVEFSEVQNIKMSDNNSLQKFFEFVGIPILEESVLKHCWSAWNHTYFNNQQREFLFKFFNNILGLNARVTHFVQNHSAECSICIANNEPRPVQAEFFLHTFSCILATRDYSSQRYLHLQPIYAECGIHNQLFNLENKTKQN
jgi:hypothetical protein